MDNVQWIMDNDVQGQVPLIRKNDNIYNKVYIKE